MYTNICLLILGIISVTIHVFYVPKTHRETSEGIEGAVTGDRVNCVSHMLYADDLGLTTNDPGEMQTMLNKLRKYAEKKGLTVNTAKSEVVHFNSKSVSLESAVRSPCNFSGSVLPLGYLIACVIPTVRLCVVC